MLRSVDELVAALAAGQYWRSDFTKNYTATDVYAAGTVVAGRWYDLTGYAQNPYTHGNYIFNAHFQGGLVGWTVSSANVAWDAANTAASKTGGASETLTQNTDCVNGTTYETIYTIAGYTGSGNITLSLGGTAGTNRSANGTYTENIVCGATANAPCVITFPTTLSAGRVENIIVRQLRAFTPYSDSAKGREAGIWHGGNIEVGSPNPTKHLLNAGIWTTAAVGAGAVAYVVDLLGCYPKILTNSASSQALTNTLTLPRYAAGDNVRAFFSLNTANGANAANATMVYTNSTGTGSRSLGATVAHTASAITGHMSHTGVAAGNFGPFLPLAGGDAGVRSVESFQFSAASASAGFIDLVLCRPLVALPVTTAFIPSERDLLTQLPSLPQVRDGAVLGLILQSGAVITSGTQWQGYIETVWN